MASRQEIVEALRWCQTQHLDIWGVLHACSSVGIEHGADTGDMIVAFVQYSKAKLS
jgi:hypothetical protein